MNRNQIKYMASATMLIDHIGAFFVPDSTLPYFMMRLIGRLTAPIMCYFLAEGFRYTSSRKKYGIRLFVFSVISQFPYAFAHGNSILTPSFNMIFTLFLSFLVLLSYETIKNSVIKTFVIFFIILISAYSDWGIIAPLWVMSFYISHNDNNYKVVAFTFVSLLHIAISTISATFYGNAWYSQLWQIGVFLFITILFLYNEKSGSKNPFSKWFFYVFYPLHLIILGIVNYI